MSNDPRRSTEDLKDVVTIVAGLAAVGGAVFEALRIAGVSGGYALSGGLAVVLVVLTTAFAYHLQKGGAPP